MMKVRFNKGLSQADTVCLPLFKRVFPKFVDGDGEGNGSVVCL